MNDAPETPFVVYRGQLLPYSTSFIATQSEAVPGYRPVYVGHERVPGWPVPADRTIILPPGPLHARKVGFLLGFDRTANEAIRRCHPALVHAHFGPEAMFVAATAKRLGLPLVVTFHGYDVLRADAWSTSAVGRMWRRRRAAVFEQAVLLVGVSEFVRSRLAELGAPAAKLVRHYIGVDTTLFSPPCDLDRRPGHVLFVGRLVPEKGVDDVVRAVAQAARHTDRVSLEIIGDGPMRSLVNDLARDLSVNVTLTGWQSNGDVRAAMRRATVLCGPSKRHPDGWREALGMVFAEAQACGLPVVAYRSGGIPEVVADGIGGLLVDEGDVDGLSDALVRCLTDGGLRHDLGAGGRRDMLARFDLETQSAHLAELYDGLRLR